MKQFALLSPAVAALLFCGAAFAAPTADACVDLQANVNAVMQARLKASVPKQDPSSFNQEGYDIKGIMSQDVTSGFSKLMSMDFSSLANTILQKGLQSSAESGAANFNNKINGVLSSYGAGGVSIQGIASGNLQSLATNYANGQATAGLAKLTASTGYDATTLAQQSVQIANAAKKKADDAAAAARAAQSQSLYSRQPVRDPN